MVAGRAVEVTIRVTTVGVISGGRPRVSGPTALQRQVADTRFRDLRDVPVDGPARPAAAVAEIVGDRGEIPAEPRERRASS